MDRKYKVLAMQKQRFLVFWCINQRNIILFAIILAEYGHFVFDLLDGSEGNKLDAMGFEPLVCLDIDRCPHVFSDGIGHIVNGHGLHRDGPFVSVPIPLTALLPTPSRVPPL